MAENIDSGMNISLEQELIADLTNELSKPSENFDSDLLLSKVRSAIREVYEDRGYEDESEQYRKKDMHKQYIKIRKRALYDYNQIAAEGESSHSENGTSRAYVDRIQYCGAVNRISRIR